MLIERYTNETNDNYLYYYFAFTSIDTFVLRLRSYGMYDQFSNKKRKLIVVDFYLKI